MNENFKFFNMQDKSLNCSLISREESAAIKGFLIFLIILGHNSFFSSETRIGMVYLYTFHIQAFFILPFLYPIKKISWQRIRDYLVRFYYPFVLIFILLTVVNEIGETLNIIPENVSRITISKDSEIREFLLTLLNGNAFNIDYFTGLQFLWFLPVMFSMSILKDIFYDTRTNNGLKFIMLLLGACFFFVYFIFGLRAPYDDSIVYTLREYSPFALTHSLGAFYMGVVGLQCLKFSKNKVFTIVAILLFILGTFICFRFQHDGEVPIDDGIRWILLLVMPFSFFFIMYKFRNILGNSIILKKMGTYSFPIYIIHPFLLKICFALISPIYGVNWFIMLFVQIFVTILSYYIAKAIYKVNCLKILFFPKNWEEFQNLKK